MSLLSRLFGVPEEPPKPRKPKKGAKKPAEKMAKPKAAAKPKQGTTPTKAPGTTAGAPRQKRTAKPDPKATPKTSAKTPSRRMASERPEAKRPKGIAGQETAAFEPLPKTADTKSGAPRGTEASPAQARGTGPSGSSTGANRRPASQAPRPTAASRPGNPTPKEVPPKGVGHRPRVGLASELAPMPIRRPPPDDEEATDAVEELEEADAPTADVPAFEPAVTVEVEEEAPDEPGGRGTVKVISTGHRARLRGDVGRMARTIEEALVELGAPAHVVAAQVGPTITRFGLAPAVVERYAPDGTLRRRERVRVSKIASRANDLALVLGARSIRIEAPVPGQSYVGLEVPNPEASSVTVASLLSEKGFREFAEKARLPFALGRDVAGRPIYADVTRLPHLLVAGATGAGKSVALNAVLAALLRVRTPEQLRLIVLDPKRVEFGWLDRVAHLLAPVVVEPEKAVETLGKLEAEMSRRYDMLADAGVRDLSRYNARAATAVPYLVVVVDELADLMMLAANDVERSICRLCQLGRAAGIHLVVATQRPSVDVVTGLIKANLPARLSFAVSSQVDSRTVLDSVGAELLLGRGDFLYLPPDAPRPVRGQGAFVAEEEVQKIARRVRRKRGSSDPYADEFAALQTAAARAAAELLQKARDLAMAYDERVSASFLQRKLRIGFAKAKELVEALRDEGLLEDEEG